MSTAIWKPVAVSIGKDGTLKVWDFARKSLKLHKTFFSMKAIDFRSMESSLETKQGEEETGGKKGQSVNKTTLPDQNYEKIVEKLTTVAIHPNGLQVLIGFADRVSMMTILINDLEELFSIDMRECKVSSFSPSGSFFALVNGFNIHVHETATGNELHVLRGHAASIKSIDWGESDTILTSFSTDGVAILWDVTKGKKVSDASIRRCSFLAGLACPYSRYESDDLLLERKANGLFEGEVGFRSIVLTAESLVQEVEIFGEPMAFNLESSDSTSAKSKKDGLSSFSSSHDLSLEEDSQFNQSEASEVNKLKRGISLERDVQVMCASKEKGIIFIGASNPKRNKKQRGGGVQGESKQELESEESSNEPSGTIYAYKIAKNGKPGMLLGSHNFHTAPITSMAIPKGKSILLSGDEEGNIFVSRFSIEEWSKSRPSISKQEEGDEEDSKTVHSLESASSSLNSLSGMSLGLDMMDDPLTISTELMRESELIVYNQTFQELERNMNQLSLDADFQMRSKDEEYKAKMDALKHDFSTELETHKKEYRDLVAQKKAFEEEFQVKWEQLTSDHASEKQELEELYESKISAEKEKVDEIEHAKDEMRMRMEETMEQMEEEHKKRMQHISDEFESRILEEQEKQRLLHEEGERTILLFEDRKEEIENQAEDMFLSEKVGFEGTLQKENRDNDSLSEEHRKIKEAFIVAQRELDVKRRSIEAARDKEVRLYESIKGLEKDIQSYKRDIKEREESISDKDMAILNLEAKNQELEKFKFVLDFKIKELRKQIAPRESEITDMRRQLEDMDTELQQYKKSNVSLTVLSSDLRRKLSALEASIEEMVLSMQRKKHKIHLIQRDLNETKALLEEEKRRMIEGDGEAEGIRKSMVLASKKSKKKSKKGVREEDILTEGKKR
jgi:WD40 repeat protein